MPEMPAPAPQSPQAPTPTRSRTPLIVGAAVGIVAVAAVAVFAVADPLHLRTPEPAPTAPVKVETRTDGSSSSASSDEGSSKDSPSGDSAAADDGAPQQDSTQTDAANDPLVVPSASTGADGYILPKVDSHTYTKEELSSLSQEDIRLASNEILARHGRKFKTASIRTYFLSKSWYDPRYEPAQYDSSSFPDPLNSYEHANYDLLMSLRTDR